ncbi:MAG: nitroreductase family protein [Promethearchaeota archaeon]
MSEQTLLASIDRTKCVKCGACKKDCPARAVEKDEAGNYSIRADFCIGCCHCACTCPAEAVVVERDGDRVVLEAWSPPALDPATSRAFLAGRRSIRQYKPDPVPRAVLDDLFSVASLTGTASNLQDWHAVVLKGDAVAYLREKVMAAFAKLHSLGKRRVVRGLARLVPSLRRQLEDPAVFEKLEALLDAWRGGADPLFYGAPVVVLFTSDKHNPFGRTNNVLAGAAATYQAQSHGLGSCFVGFAEIYLKLAKRVRRKLGVPKNHEVNLVFTLGYQDVKYLRLPARKRVPVVEVTDVAPGRGAARTGYKAGGREAG